MQALFRTLPGMMKEIESSEEVREAVVFAAWRRIAGAQVAERTAPIALEKQRLIIAVADKTWKRNLEELSGQLLFKLNDALDLSLVKFIEFRIEPDSVNRGFCDIETSIEKADFARKAIAGLSPDLLTSAAAIKDAATRRTFMLAAANCLARSRNA